MTDYTTLKEQYLKKQRLEQESFHAIPQAFKSSTSYTKTNKKNKNRNPEIIPLNPLSRDNDLPLHMKGCYI